MVGKASALTRRLVEWYRRHRRDLPWRVPPGSPPGDRPDPYHVLVSEAMLQQTQVATVVPYFRRFLERFPTIQSLADADEQDVLRTWQGLGYYSRARNLRLAARFVGERFGGQIPPNVEDLRRLPGVGRYTAGAVASLAFDRCAPIVDGNVARVVCRIDRMETDPREKAMLELLWTRAAELVPASCPGDFNSALMELGATVCTPRAPKCLLCPVQQHCEAFAAGVQERIPVPREDKPRPLLRRRTYCIRRTDPGGVVRWLIEQRPPKGRWAGMWQFVTRAPGEPLAGWRTTRPRRIGKVLHGLTHRRYEFDVYVCDARPEDGAPVVPGPSAPRSVAPVRWVDLGELDGYPLPRPHLRIAQMLRETLPARPIAPGKAVRQTR
jgi:A/G-specific adenine glycosylase